MLNALSPITQNSPDLWLAEFPFPQGDINKYDRGHALICGGAVMTGATRLAARAAQRIGAGLVTLAAPHEALPIYATTLESVIVREADDESTWQALLDDPKKNALLIGCGLGVGDKQKKFVELALATHKPCVLDADALTNFSACPDDLLNRLHENCILTPHEGEFARVFGGRIKADMDKPQRAARAAQISKAIVLLKGAETFIASPDGRVICNSNAPPWLATAGAGDVLAGMILGLIAQKMSLFHAAAAAVWLHGDIATRHGLGLIAEDLVDGIPAALEGIFLSR